MEREIYEAMVAFVLRVLRGNYTAAEEKRAVAEAEVLPQVLDRLLLWKSKGGE